MIVQRQTLTDTTISDTDEHLWTYIRASGALLQSQVHQLLAHEKELLQLVGRRISEKISLVDAPPSGKMPRQRRCQILVVDDHSRIRTALRMLLAGYDDIEVMGEACNGEQAVILTEAFQPDVVVMDTNMPKMNGFTATGLIKRQWPKTVVIALSFSTDPYVRKAVLAAGAATLIPKQEAAEHLYEAINTHWVAPSPL